jgi:NUMOD3 motif
MNYSKIYYSIINRAKSRLDLPIVEVHHILPKSLGGSNKKENLVRLTPREHFVCHLLLSKMHSGKEKQKMVYALWAIMNLCNNHQHRRKVKGRLYENLRKEFVSAQRSTIGANRVNTGKKRPDRTSASFTTEWKANISAAKKGKPTWNKGISHSDETKALQSQLAKNRPVQECPHCKKLVAGPSNFLRWHNDNCKLKN